MDGNTRALSPVERALGVIAHGFLSTHTVAALSRTVHSSQPWAWELPLLGDRVYVDVYNRTLRPDHVGACVTRALDRVLDGEAP